MSNKSAGDADHHDDETSSEDEDDDDDLTPLTERALSSTTSRKRKRTDGDEDDSQRATAAVVKRPRVEAADHKQQTPCGTSLRVGDFCDVKDNKTWRLAELLEIKEAKLHLRFVGWTDPKWNVWLPATSERIVLPFANVRGYTGSPETFAEAARTTECVEHCMWKRVLLQGVHEPQITAVQRLLQVALNMQVGLGHSTPDHLGEFGKFARALEQAIRKQRDNAKASTGGGGSSGVEEYAKVNDLLDTCADMVRALCEIGEERNVAMHKQEPTGSANAAGAPTAVETSCVALFGANACLLTHDACEVLVDINVLARASSVLHLIVASALTNSRQAPASTASASASASASSSSSSSSSMPPPTAVTATMTTYATTAAARVVIDLSGSELKMCRTEVVALVELLIAPHKHLSAVLPDAPRFPAVVRLGELAHKWDLPGIVRKCALFVRRAYPTLTWRNLELIMLQWKDTDVAKQALGEDRLDANDFPRDTLLSQDRTQRLVAWPDWARSLLLKRVWDNNKAAA